jgi:hypothetical protein
VQHDHLVFIDGTESVPEWSCGFYPGRRVSLPLSELPICREPGTHRASKDHPATESDEAFTMSGHLCTEHSVVVANCPDCTGIKIEEIL